MNPPIDKCPFCKNDLKKMYDKEESWFCQDCRCETDSSMPKYLVRKYESGDSTFVQEFSVGKYYLYNDFGNKCTKFCVLSRYIIEWFAMLPLQNFDFESITEEQLLAKFKMWDTFS